MNSTNYLPRNDRKFLQWVINFLSRLFPSLTRFSFPNDVYQDLAAKRDDFATKLDVAESPATRTKSAIDDKNVARETLESATRRAVQRSLAHNPDGTGKDHDDLGLPNYKTTRTPAPVAATYPDYDIDSGTIRRLTISFYDQGQKKSKAKPAGQHGAEIKWAISDTPIIDVVDLTNSSFDTHTPLTLEFQGHERGKTVYFCLCWENTRGDKGPWSEIMSAIIP
jgi:hypothetical protein